MRCRDRVGFTLVELLVVIAIIGILIALLLPAVQAAREAARRIQCTSNLKQLGLAFHTYHVSNNILPYSGMYWHSSGQLGWTSSILPFIEQDAIYDKMSFDDIGDPEDVSDPHKGWAGANAIEGYLCPSADTYDRQVQPYADAYTNHYYTILGPIGTIGSSGSAYGTNNTGVFYWEEANEGLGRRYGSKLADATDGTSNTYMIGEQSWGNTEEICGWVGMYHPWVLGIWNTQRAGESVWYGARHVRHQINSPPLYYCEPFTDLPFGSNHPGGTHFAMGDGSTQFVSETIDYAVYLARASRSGGELTIAE